MYIQKSTKISNGVKIKIHSPKFFFEKLRRVKIILSVLTIVGFIGFGLQTASAHTGDERVVQTSVDQNKSVIDSESAEGKIIQERIQSKELSCGDLKDGDFEKLGDYYMEQMIGNNHAAMDTMMQNMIGAKKNDEMHIVMGKRLSGCDSSAFFSNEGVGFMPTISMMGGNNMMGNWSGPNNNKLNNFMMNFGYGGFSVFGLLWMILWWGLIIVGIIALTRWLNNKSVNNSNKSAVDILKERYAKGEITKHEFESMKKDLQ